MAGSAAYRVQYDEAYATLAAGGCHNIQMDPTSNRKIIVSTDASTVVSCDAVCCKGYADLATSTTSWVKTVRLRVAPVHGTVQSTPTNSYQGAVVLDDNGKV